MKLIQAERIEEDNIGEEHLESYSSSVATDNQELIIDTITSGLYSNPVGSIIRELTSNGIDATLERNKIYPVIVKLGYDVDNDTNYFEVIDNGIGMDKHNLTKIYISIFESTKRSNNDLIGGYGIGSKSPLSLVDEIYITTIKDGIKINAIYFKTNSLPDLTILSEEEVEDDTISGTSIKIFIEDNKVHQFTSEIYKQLRYFSNVIFINEYDTESAKKFNESIVYENEYYLYNQDLSDDEHKELHIALGNVSYPINFSLLQNKYNDYKSLPLAVRFDIGELETTKSRESIKYTNRTIKNLEERLDEFIEYLTNTQTERLKTDSLVTYMLQTKDEFIIYDPNKNRIRDLFTTDLHVITIKLPSVITRTLKYKYTKEKTPYTLNSFVLSLDDSSGYTHLRKYTIPLLKGINFSKKRFFGSNSDIYTEQYFDSSNIDPKELEEWRKNFKLFPDDRQNTTNSHTTDLSPYLRFRTKTYREITISSYFDYFFQESYTCDTPVENFRIEQKRYDSSQSSSGLSSSPSFKPILNNFCKDYLFNKSTLFEDINLYFEQVELIALRFLTNNQLTLSTLLKKYTTSLSLHTRYYISSVDLKFNGYEDSLFPYFKYHNTLRNLNIHVITNQIYFLSETLKYSEYAKIKYNNRFATITEAVLFHKQFVKDVKSKYINFLDIPDEIIEDFENKVITFIERDQELKKEVSLRKRRETQLKNKNKPKQDKIITLRTETDYFRDFSYNHLINNYDEIYFPIYAGRESEQKTIISELNEGKSFTESKLLSTRKRISEKIVLIHNDISRINDSWFTNEFNELIKEEDELKKKLNNIIETLTSTIFNYQLQQSYNQCLNLFENMLKDAVNFSSINRYYDDRDYSSKIYNLSAFGLSKDDKYQHNVDGSKKQILIVMSYRKQDIKHIKALPNYRTHTDYFKNDPTIRNILGFYYTVHCNVLKVDNRAVFNSLYEMKLYEPNNHYKQFKDFSLIKEKYATFRKSINKFNRDFYFQTSRSEESSKYTSNNYSLPKTIETFEKLLFREYVYGSGKNELKMIYELCKDDNTFIKDHNITLNNRLDRILKDYFEFYTQYEYLFTRIIETFESKLNSVRHGIDNQNPIMIHLNKIRDTFIAQEKISIYKRRHNEKLQKLQLQKRYDIWKNQEIINDFCRNLLTFQTDKLLLSAPINN